MGDILIYSVHNISHSVLVNALYGDGVTFFLVLTNNNIKKYFLESTDFCEEMSNTKILNVFYIRIHTIEMDCFIYSTTSFLKK